MKERDYEKIDLSNIAPGPMRRYLKRNIADKKIQDLILEINKIVKEDFNGNYENQFFIILDQSKDGSLKRSKYSKVNISIKRGDLK